MTAKTRTTNKSRASRASAGSRTTHPRRSPAATPTAGQTVSTRARTASENRLWKALQSKPNSSVAQLSQAARVGKSTAGKILVTWAAAGTVTRATGARSTGRRTADLWAIITTDITTDTTTPQSRTPQGGTTNKAPRLASGALRGMIEDYLNAHPGTEFSPNALGKALDRSAGAVNNALEKLASDGYAIKTNEAPKRFTLATTQ